MVTAKYATQASLGALDSVPEATFEKRLYTLTNE
jgi:hypothetical protein